MKTTAAGLVTATRSMKLMKSLLERLRTRRLASAFVLLATLTAAIVGGSFAAHGVRGQEQQNSSTDATPLKVVNSTVAPNEFVRIAKLVGPAVVNINTRTLPKQATGKGKRNFHGRVQPVPQDPGDDDQQQDQGQDQQQGPQNWGDLFHFFGGQIPDQEGGDDGQVHESLGSGFIVDPKGYIITNYHVIEKADQIYVKLSTDPDNEDLGRVARVIGTDKATDLAVIKIDTSSPLPTVKMGNSDDDRGRRLGGGDRQPIRAGADGNGGHYLGQEPDHRAGRERAVSALHPDGRGDQSGQLRRAAAEYERRSDRREHGDLYAVGRLSGTGLRAAVEYRGGCLQRPDRPQPQEGTRLDRYPLQSGTPGRGESRLRLQERRAGAAGAAGRAGGKGRPQGAATSF